jgi:hypothetical protein
MAPPIHSFSMSNSTSSAWCFFRSTNPLGPGLVGIGAAGPHRFHFDIQIVFAAIDDEVDLASVRQKVGFVSDWSGDRFVFEQDLRHRQLVNLLGNCTIIALGIGTASCDRLFKLSPEHIAAHEPGRDQIVIFGANRLDETIKLRPLMDDAHKMLDLGDHAARREGIRQVGYAPDLVEAESDERRALLPVAPYRASDLLDRHACAAHVVPLYLHSVIGIERTALDTLLDFSSRRSEESRAVAT